MSPPYKKLRPLISAFIKNSIFGNNRDPCFRLKNAKGDPNPQKGPLGVTGTLKRTHCGTVKF